MVHPRVITYNRDPAIEASVIALQERSGQLDKDVSAANEHFNSLIEIAKTDGISSGLIERLRRLRDEYLGELMIRKTSVSLSLEKKRIIQAEQALLFSACQEYNGRISGRFQRVNEKKQVVRDKYGELANALLMERQCMLAAQVPTLSPDKVRDSIVMSNANEAARLVVDGIDVGIDREMLHERFPSAISQRPARGKVPKNKFDEHIDLSSRASVKALLDTIAESDGPIDITLDLPLDASVTHSIVLKAENGQFRPIDTFSAGELSKVYVLHFLEKAINNAGGNAIVLYDQPESNMEKEFLLSSLATKLDQLRKNHQIFIATHEPLLVVNADANELILATNEKKVGQGNQVHYENRSFVGVHGKTDAIEEVANLIDGGTKAVRHRSDVYEGMMNNAN